MIFFFHFLWQIFSFRFWNGSIFHKNLTWRYLSCRAEGDSSMTFEASLSALEARFSPSAAITLALASREASASAAIALCSCSGRRASLLQRTESIRHLVKLNLNYSFWNETEWNNRLFEHTKQGHKYLIIYYFSEEIRLSH